MSDSGYRVVGAAATFDTVTFFSALRMPYRCVWFLTDLSIAMPCPAMPGTAMVSRCRRVYPLFGSCIT